MLRHGLCGSLLTLLACLYASITQAALQCTQVFPGGIQSHSPTGFIQMGYQSRVHGSGPTLNAPTVTHTHTGPDQVGLCDGVKCTATGRHAVGSAPGFRTGSVVPTAFRTGTAGDGVVSTGYQGQLARGAGDYGAVTVGQEATLRFTTNGGTYLLRGIGTLYRANIEFAPGDYWIDGNFTMAEQTVIRPLAGSSGVVRLYVRGKFDVGQMRFEGFADGNIELYVQGDVEAGENFEFPGPLHATGQIRFGTKARVAGGVYAAGLFTGGNSAVIRYPGNGGRHMGALKPAYKATLEMAPGSYWINGDLDLSVESTVRKLPGSGEGAVRLFVNGDITLAYAASFEGFAAGELLMYATGRITLKSQKDIPAFVYADGDVTINFSGGARYRGGITGRNVYIGQESIVEYVDPVDLGELCESSSGPVVDHFRLSFSTPRFSCEPIPVVIRACADATCSSTVAVNRALTLTPAERWLGNGTVTFVGTDTATAYLKRIPGTLRLGVAGEIARCDNGDCALEILRSGFVLGIPEVIAGVAARVDIQAMRLVEGSEACVADRSFADGDQPRELAFWSQYGLPASGTRAVRINNQAIGGSASEATPISLRFDAQARSSVTLRYDDAGALQLHTRFVGSGDEEGLDMQGSALFVARPAGFCIRADAAGCDGPECPLFAPNGQVVRAGDAFDLLITPVAHAEGQALCSNADARQTPNFTARLRLSAPVQTPADGADGVLDITEYQHPLGGTYRLKHQKVHEVGSFRIEARSEHYEGLAPFGSVGERIGRFVPAYLQAEFNGEPNGPALQAGCTAGGAGFSYQGQPIGFAVTPELTVTGKSRNGGTTRNYDRAGYWKLDDELPPALTFATGKPGDAGRLSPMRFQLQPDAVHDGSRTYRLEGELVYRRPSGAPGAGDAPFSPELVLVMAPGQLKDADATCQAAGCAASLESAPFGFVNPASDIRLGRLRIGNAHGSELTELALPVIAEHFDGQGYRRNALDGCTRFDPADAEPFVPAGPGGAEPLLSYQGQNAGGGYRLQAGAGAYLLSAPGVAGSQRVRYPGLSDWLTHDWDGDGVPEAPSGLATFGIYRGHDRVIFRRELIGR